jgi:hypothetical protein
MVLKATTNIQHSAPAEEPPVQQRVWIDAGSEVDESLFDEEQLQDLKDRGVLVESSDLDKEQELRDQVAELQAQLADLQAERDRRQAELSMGVPAGGAGDEVGPSGTGLATDPNEGGKGLPSPSTDAGTSGAKVESKNVTNPNPTNKK